MRQLNIQKYSFMREKRFLWTGVAYGENAYIPLHFFFFLLLSGGNSFRQPKNGVRNN